GRPAASLGEGLLGRLLAQLEADVGPAACAVIRRRFGLGQAAETCAALARDLGVTGERVRQVSLAGAAVYRVRWPQGRHLLGGLCDRLRAAAAAGGAGGTAPRRRAAPGTPRPAGE